MKVEGEWNRSGEEPSLAMTQLGRAPEHSLQEPLSIWP